jgi:adenine phosphoribosyltransferase
MDLRQHIRDVPDFPKPGIIFKDITPLLGNPAAFRHTVESLVARYRGTGVSKVAGIESRGFIFGAAVALELGAGFVPLRKKGKLPHRTVAESYDLEYGTDTIEMHEDAIAAGESVVVIDDVIATGGTLAAACKLVAKLGGRVAEAATVIELSFLDGRSKLEGTPFFALISY